MLKKSVSFGFLVGADFLAVFISFVLAFFIRLEILPYFFPSLLERPVFLEIYLSKSYMFLLWLLVFLYEKTYTKRYSFRDEAWLLLKSTSISFTGIMIMVFITQQYFEYSRIIILSAWLLSIILLPVFRYATKRLIIKFGLWKKRVLIITSAGTTASLIESIQKNKILGYEIVGILSGELRQKGKIIKGVRVWGHYSALAELKEKIGFEDIIVCLPDLGGDKLVGLLKEWDQECETIRYVPRTGDLLTTGVEIENIGKFLSLSLMKNLHKPWNILLKTVFEFLSVLVMLILFIPFFLVISLAIKIDTRGPVFFVQDRFGKKAKKIRVIKFRSMYVKADNKLKQYLMKNPEAKEEWEKYNKLRTYDPRVTKVGKILRKYSLDELPQFINVLKGDMGLVGPRPYMMEELKRLKSAKSLLLQVRPGITGLWQTSGRSLLPFQERLNLDEYYLRNWSFWLDIVIILKTVKVFIGGEGAY